MIKATARIAATLAALLPAVVFAAPAAAPAPGIIKLPLRPVVTADMRACSAKTASGLGYTALKEGTGEKPGKTDFVLINYVGYLATTGQVFDQNQATPLNLGEVIPGFTEGLQLMQRGSIYRLCVPASLGYGATGAGDAIPANADLVFQIELIDFKTAAQIDEMRKAQAAQAPAGDTPPPAPAH